MMGYNDPTAHETYWAEYWDEFLQDNGVAEYVKVRYEDAGTHLCSIYDTPESWSAAVDSHTEDDDRITRIERIQGLLPCYLRGFE